MKFIVYKALNKVNGKVYIGCTSVSLKRRKIQHKCEAKKPRYYFHHAIKKYGFNKFKFGVLCKVKNIEEMFEMEAQFIQQYRANNPSFGYNLSNGGDGNVGWNGMRGESHPMAKMTWDKIKNIRDEYKKGITNQVDLAKKYKIPHTYLWSILHNKNWVDPNYKFNKQIRIGGYRGKIYSQA